MALSKHQEGSIREMMAVFLPLWLSLLSTNLMCFVDRWLLSHHSMAAMNAGAVAASMAWALWEIWTLLICTSDVFVAHRNGAGDSKKVGTAVWQVIYLAAASSLFFIPMGIWGSDFIYGHARYAPMEQQCFTLLMFVGPFQALYTALASFWIGRGQTRFLLLLVVSANILNFIVDLLLIPSMGVKGAVIGTGLGIFVQVCALAWKFLSVKNQKRFGTGNWRFDFGLTRQMLRLGTPSSLLAVSELMGGPMIYIMMSRLGESHLTASVICQNLTLICWSFSEALYKTSITLTGNMLGSGRDGAAWKVIVRGATLVSMLGVMVLLGSIFFGGEFAAIFFTHEPEALAGLSDQLQICLMLAAIYVVLEGCRMMLAGVLTAAGDTAFLAVVCSLSTWMLLVLPTYLLSLSKDPSVVNAIAIWLGADACICIVCLARIASGRHSRVPAFAAA